MSRRHAQRGFSLIELMVTVVVIAILAAVALPNMAGFLDRKRLVGQTEAIANLIQFARSEAIKHPTSTAAQQVSATIKPAAPWFVGLTNGTAACSDAATCVLSEGGTNVTRYITATECTGCTMSIVDGGGTAITTPVVVVFDLRGMAPAAPGYRFSLQSPQGKSLAVSLSAIGRITTCSPDGSVSGYPTSC